MTQDIWESGGRWLVHDLQAAGVDVKDVRGSLEDGLSSSFDNGIQEYGT